MSLNFTILLVFAVTLASPAASQVISDVQSYLAQNATQQEIFLTRQLRAQPNLAAECAPGTDAASFRPRFEVWLDENPTFTTRPAQFAITAALVDFCKQPTSSR
ncbi:hypothetical protein [Ruegeria atlantica]|uniref:DUF732 domain-containing protein n=1 Tax=Ruegeria atlantica TaxID=81569 RepID=A0A0P1ECG9_9RHOB|nr:hypothetical protein [Ruegeria atlantica]CUH47354.1 hypothetical protein RUA4292_01523 [Ruegeria atlantica]